LGGQQKLKFEEHKPVDSDNSVDDCDVGDTDENIVHAQPARAMQSQQQHVPAPPTNQFSHVSQQQARNQAQGQQMQRPFVPAQDAAPSTKIGAGVFPQQDTDDDEYQEYPSQDQQQQYIAPP
jgi:hypothetical protein